MNLELFRTYFLFLASYFYFKICNLFNFHLFYKYLNTFYF
nr:MAG TPA: hypothetical protein [Caudoviricetes sp.]